MTAMKSRWAVSALVLTFVALAQPLVGTDPSQFPHSSETKKPLVALVELFPPIYPPLARQASISGDVTIRLRILKDGTIESAEVVKGHPILIMAAMESAKKSHFECRACDNRLEYLLTYSFVVKKFSPDSCKLANRKPEVRLSSDHITITAEALCVVAN